MLKRDLFIGIIIFVLFAIGIIMTIENIKAEQKTEGVSLILDN